MALEQQGNQITLTLDAPAHVEAVLKLCTSCFVMGTQEDLQVSATCDHPESLLAHVPPCRPENLGSREFCDAFGIKYPYLAGSMANGISSVALVEALGNAGMLSFYGAGGMPLDNVEEAIDQLQAALGVDGPYGFNLLHNPSDPSQEAAMVDLYIQRGVHLVEASAYTRVTPHLVKYRIHGIHRDENGVIVTPNRIIAKVSRVEVAERFLSPPAQRMLDDLLRKGMITEEEAELATHIPLAQAVTGEADSGGHTDNRPALTMMTDFLALRDRIMTQYAYNEQIFLGLAGGISTPASAAAAFALGADYIMTGSMNQSCVESGTSDAVRALLAEATQSDVAMAPSAFLFERGGKVQVLKRGTQFSVRADNLYKLYTHYACIEDIPEKERTKLEETLYFCSLEEVWEQTKAFFAEKDPKQLDRAEKDPKFKMALIFRSYLGRTSRWAYMGDPDRVKDYQVWCGPAMGAFNEWAKGSCLEALDKRTAENVALNILFGAAVCLRATILHAQGIDVPEALRNPAPLEADQLKTYLSEHA